MNVESYLSRIHYNGSLEPTLQTLSALQEAHLLTVPFENLSIHLGQPIILDEAALFHKIVTQQRGGFCYELNGLFAALLRTLGFHVTQLAAGVFSPTRGSFGPEFDHMTLLAQLDKPWLVDVGFGESFHKPLLLKDAIEQEQDDDIYRLMHNGTYWTLQQHSDDHTWENQYRFTLQPHQLSDYTAMCHYHQTSSASSFTQRRICTLMTRQGRVTLSDMRLIITEHGKRDERLLTDQGEYNTALHEYFGIKL